MTKPIPSLLRWSATLLAVVAALASALQALLFVSRSHPLLLPGTVGSAAAAMVLVRIGRTGLSPNRIDATLLVLGLLAPLTPVAMMLLRPVDGPGTLDFALRTMMKSDLRTLVAAEDAYFAEHATYATLEELGDRFGAQNGVTISLTVAGRSLQALARHSRTTKTCAIFLGGSPMAPATNEREPACSK